MRLILRTLGIFALLVCLMGVGTVIGAFLMLVLDWLGGPILFPCLLVIFLFWLSFTLASEVE